MDRLKSPPDPWMHKPTQTPLGREVAGLEKGANGLNEGEIGQTSGCGGISGRCQRVVAANRINQQAHHRKQAMIGRAHMQYIGQRA